MQPQMPARTPEVFAYLKRCAREMRTATYGEIGDAVNLPAIGVNTPLNHIRDRVCLPKGLPWLSALAVNGRTRLPSDGWLPDGAAIGDEHLPIVWRGIVLQVFATNWDAINLENDN